jgi:hypothetical protein
VRKRVLLLIGVFIVLAAACGGDDDTTPETDGLPPTTADVPAGTGGPSVFGDDVVAVWVNRDLGVGSERLLIGVFETDGTRLGSPGIPVTLEASPLDDLASVQSSPAGFTWTVPDAIGFYRAQFDFNQAGIWQVTVRPDRGPPLQAILIEVRDDACRAPDAMSQGVSPCAPRVGELAPRVTTPTLDDEPLEALTTDPQPDSRLYALSLDEALDNGRPTVVVFATPAYCQTAACGPIVQNIRAALDDYAGVDFVHIEVYTGLLEPDFAPTPDRLAPALQEWTLPSEPWVFVTDSSGVIVARFEGALDPIELEPYL